MVSAGDAVAHARLPALRAQGWGHHLTNLLLHAATSIALVLVLRRMTGELKLSGLVALVFAIHPQHVESVAWVAERRDMLSGLFFVLALALTWDMSATAARWPYYLVVAAMLTLSLMAKATAVTLPPLLLLLDYWPLGRWGEATDLRAAEPPLDRPGLGWLVVEKLPLAALSAGACVMTMWTHTKAPLGCRWRCGSRERRSPASVTSSSFSFRPAWRSSIPIRRTDGRSGKWPGRRQFWWPSSALAVIGRRRYPFGLVGWFWFLGMLVPVLGLVQVSRQAMADRYTYLPRSGCRSPWSGGWRGGGPTRPIAAGRSAGERRRRWPP